MPAVSAAISAHQRQTVKRKWVMAANEIKVITPRAHVMVIILQIVQVRWAYE